MLTNLLDLKPGCFGSALAFNGDTVECKTCPFIAHCEPEHKLRRAKLNALFGLQDTDKSKLRRPKRAANEDLIEGSELPKKVQALLVRIKKLGVPVLEALRSGRNPFVNNIPFLSVACDLLLANGSVDRGTLRQNLMTRLTWSKGTADAHVAQTFQALVAIDAAVERDGGLEIKRI